MSCIVLPVMAQVCASPRTPPATHYIFFAKPTPWQKSLLIRSNGKISVLIEILSVLTRQVVSEDWKGICFFIAVVDMLSLLLNQYNYISQVVNEVKNNPTVLHCISTVGKIRFAGTEDEEAEWRHRKLVRTTIAEK